TLSQAVVSNKKAELGSRIVSGELVKFINASIGTEAWDTKVVRTEQLTPNLIAADVQIHASKLGTVGNGTAVLMLARTPSGWKLSGVELFLVRLPLKWTNVPRGTNCFRWVSWWCWLA